MKKIICHQQTQLQQQAFILVRDTQGGQPLTSQLNKRTEVRLQISILYKTLSVVGTTEYTTCHSHSFLDTFIAHLQNHQGF